MRQRQVRQAQAFIGTLAGAAGLVTMIGLWVLLYRLTRESASTVRGTIPPEAT